MKALITTVPFGSINQLPLELLNASGIDYLINPLNKKLTEEELIEIVSDFDIIIAGTEPITQKVIDKAPNLKLISRVGIGLDSVDLLASEKKGILVSYTPDAPAPAVAELTMGLIFSLLRFIHVANFQLHRGQWNRIFGKRLSEITLGVIGVGRIGSRVIRRTKPFGSPRLLVNDINPTKQSDMDFKLEWVSKQKIYEEADIICIHLPLTRHTHNMITKKELMSMKKDAAIINVSRGGIIIEIDLYEVLKSGHLSGAAIDVFESEPYSGELTEIERCILTSHMGSMSIDCRSRMEIEATEEVVRFCKNESLMNEVPDAEYEVQRDRLFTKS
jgi:D-3-phosphoglycerate dehydrogenase / 2-oxoglutarate reductase